MGKSYRLTEGALTADCTLVPIGLLSMSEVTIRKVRSRSRSEIEAQRIAFETGVNKKRIVLVNRPDGSFHIRLGRECVLAAVDAGLDKVEAIVIDSPRPVSVRWCSCGKHHRLNVHLFVDRRESRRLSARRRRGI